MTDPIKRPTMKLPSELKTKINKIAHAAGVAHGEQVKLQLLIEIDRRINAGASQDAMLAELGLRAFTDADLAAMVLTDAELMAMALTEDKLVASDIRETRQTPPKAI